MRPRQASLDLGVSHEAVANAPVHRDDRCLGAVHVRLADDGMTISNPGGLTDPSSAHGRASMAAGLPHMSLHGLRRSF